MTACSELSSSQNQECFEGSGLKPPLKWAGGKRWLVPTLHVFWQRYLSVTKPNVARLVEPFSGGLAVALGLNPQQAKLCDINEHVINFFHRLQDGFVIRDLDMRNDKYTYYQHRQRFNDLIDDNKALGEEGAALFYYLNRTGFNGLCRFNRQGRYNVPFGLYKTIRYRNDFLDYQPTLANWQFVHRHFDALDCSDTDFIYADPPYDTEFRHYSRFGFEWSDQQRLAHWLSQHKGPVVLSNQATERIVELYQDCGFELKMLDAPRMISCNGNRSRALEVLAYKNISFV